MENNKHKQKNNEIQLKINEINKFHYVFNEINESN